MTYDETIAYLYEQLPMFSRDGVAAYKKDLHNITALCNALNDPQAHLKCIHVAGTNGKGSTCHMLAAILQKAGYKTGLFTSPHINDFRERIRINGEMIERDFVVEFTERTKNITRKIRPSFFELTAAMAFEYFVSNKTDIAIIETGLGGRLDSTNVISPVLSIITNIGIDHTDLLGETLAEIAGEKAGIIKNKIPVIIGEASPDTKDVFINKASLEQAPLHFAEDKYMVEYIDPEGPLLLCNIKNRETNIVEKLRLDLGGIYQAKNARTVLCCIELMRQMGFTITEEVLHTALENVKSLTGLRGRWDILYKDPVVIIDAAHNVDGMTQLFSQLDNVYPKSNYHFVLGFVKDKDISSMLQLFPSKAAYYFTNAHIARALPHQELKKLAGIAGLRGESYDDVNEAIRQARSQAGKDDIIIVCGSFFILSELKG